MENNTESAMFLKYQETRDVNIRNEIVNEYLYLAEIIAKKFINREWIMRTCIRSRLLP